ncbi:flagellar hook-associated protein FlgK [Tanticharoenia sakaeratensis]|uniref:Flagellar hook-associated protein 1 n=1 Tax=Tanticharoenia sakaeratensis NBRC 103193 TaxID=1231623 RepID=A0A0D6MJK7_9PROT|nr:flagellar hook-associated protein FlgK [Tanticharoenia sakaeratensis]GAN53797.1 flagellar hook-associated protein 1 FlgK [Tanticharoenia sakaeratensis NBRC 103193]GBQ22339.1 flagellar hook-associated protein FlgK [Tanticharoenia sakaeratensis NBRC 103193]
MGLTDALSIASSGLNATQYALTVASQNISNANTAGYSAEVANVSSRAANGIGNGVSSGSTTIVTNAALTNALYTQNASVAGLTTTSSALSTITSLQGSTSADSGSSGTLSDTLGNVQTALISLTSTPTNSAAQSTVISNAQTLCQTIQTLGNAYQSARQTAQDGIVSSVSSVNTDLTTIGSLSSQIMSLTASGGSTADLENQRNAALSSLSSELSINYTTSANGDMTITTTNGTVLPTHDYDTSGAPTVSSTWPLSTQSASVSAGSAYPGTGSDALPGVTLNGRDVTSSLTGGTLGANITLRDTTLPTMQAQLDSFSSTLASRFDAQGMDLFTTASGATPGTSTTETAPGGIVGLSQQITVNPSYVSDPSSLVGGTSGTTTAVQNVLSYAFGSTLADNSTQPDAPTTGLGVTGTLSTGYSGNTDILSLATALTANQAATANTASSGLTTAQTAQSSLSSKVASATGVSVDNEMANVVTLQNAYAANAKVVSAVQTMFTDLLNAVGS